MRGIKIFGSRSMPNWLGLVSVVAIAALFGCTKKQDENSEPSAITNRSVLTPDKKVILIRLASDALLVDAGMSEQGAVVSDEDKARINAEHQEIERQLNQLSDQIEILWRYKFVLNAVAVVIPTQLEDEIAKIPGVRGTHNDLPFGRPERIDPGAVRQKDLSGKNSVSFIGAQKVRRELRATGPDGRTMPVDGNGIKVGIIDTGIDYTHRMLGGSGHPMDYEAALETISGEGFFPNRKVIGGIDLVGRDYDAGSHEFDKQIPKPDQNPLDEHGHGTHVAGTVAGIGDSENTYTGVAPEAKLFAIKVFGQSGSTTDSVVIAALEYAVDPEMSDNPSNHLDVVNLSLGSSFGLPHILYDEAVRNLVKAGVTPVMSAGNSGDIPYIVGSPGASDAAISVAASVDDMDHNWKFNAVEFSSPDLGRIPAKAVEGSITRPVSESGDVSGKLVSIGLAAEDLPEDVKEELNGHIALIDRGQVSFSEKIQRAYEAGAKGIIMVNNRDGEPISMGGSGMVPIPGIMIVKSLGDQIKSSIRQGSEVTVNFGSELKIEEPELIDQMTGFSSRGPRSFDSVIKPEISAPGQNIISAKVGSGYQGVAFSGTSMAAPHMAGVVALLKQYRSGISEQDVRSVLMGTGKILQKPGGDHYSVARQGAGRVQAFKALTSTLLTYPATLSLGEHEVASTKVVRKTLTVKNGGTSVLRLSIAPKGGESIALRTNKEQIALEPGQQTELQVFATLKSPAESVSSQEHFGWVQFFDGKGEPVHVVPVLGVVNKQSKLKAGKAMIHGSSPSDSPGAFVEVELKNPGQVAGEALLFNLLAQDQRKEGIGERSRISDICDLESVGYRVVSVETDGGLVPMIQFAAKLYSPVTTWNHCEISVQLDGNGDGIADQELLGTDLSSLSGAYGSGTFYSVLTDAQKMRDIRAVYDEVGGTEDYQRAIVDVQDLKVYHHGTIAILTARLDKLARTSPGLMKIKVASLVTSTVIKTGDDFLKNHASKWQTVDPYPEMSAFYDFPESTMLAAGESRMVYLTKGEKNGKLIAYFPRNPVARTVLRKDQQSQVLQNKYLY